MTSYFILICLLLVVLGTPWYLHGVPRPARDRVLRVLVPLVCGVVGAVLAQFLFLGVPAFAQTQPHFSDLWIARRLMIGPVNDVSDSNRMIEGLIKDVDEPVEMHVEGGGTLGYVGFGMRNDRGVDGSNVTLAGGAAVAYGSAYPLSVYGRSLADMAVFSANGTSSRGLMIGSQVTGPVLLGTASSASNTEPRWHWQDQYKVLTDAVTTNVVQVDVPASAITGGIMYYSIWAVNATDQQCRSGTLSYTVVNKAGTETATCTQADIVAVSTGTLTATVACSTSPTNGILITVNADTSLTPLAMGVNWSLSKNAGLGAITAQ